MWHKMPRPGRTRATLSISILALSLALPALGAPSERSETWMGMYLGEQKIGYACISQSPSELRGSKVTKTETTSETKMTVLGTELTQSIRTTVYTDQSSHPVYEEFKMSSGGKTTEVFADFEPGKVTARLVTNAGESKKTIAVPPGEDLIGDTYNPSSPDKLAVGTSYKRRAFNPLTLTLDLLSIKIDRADAIKHKGKKKKALVMVTKTPLADMTSWLSEDGKTIYRIDAPMGIVMVEESKEEAMGKGAGSYAPPQDFAVVTSVPANIDLPGNRQVKRLHIKLDGLPGAAYILSDPRQHVQTQTDDGKSATYLVRTLETDPDAGGKRSDAFPDKSSYLSDAPYLSLDSDKVRQAASGALGQEQDIVRSAERLRKLVYTSMKPISSIGVLRPAADILDSPTGVCRDYAILFAALARSSGIPTKLVAGLVYARGGLYYHAWNEVWSGKAWVAVDSTLPDASVDATHIKLIEGDPADMFKLAGIVGQLKAEILSFD